MATPVFVDHLLVAALIVVGPLKGAWAYRRMVGRIRAGEPGVLMREYLWTIVLEWALVAVVLTLWWATGRPAAALGLALPGGARLAIGVAATALGLAFFHLQVRAVEHLDAAGLGRLRQQVLPVADLMPRTPAERARFRQLSITAGICEEVVCRGYLIWYFGTFVGVWPAVVVAALAFGALHLYQGGVGVLKTGTVGLLTGALYVASGSLLWPMILHAATDLQGGAIARRALAAEVA